MITLEVMELGGSWLMRFRASMAAAVSAAVGGGGAITRGSAAWRAARHVPRQRVQQPQVMQSAFIIRPSGGPEVSKQEKRAPPEVRTRFRASRPHAGPAVGLPCP